MSIYPKRPTVEMKVSLVQDYLDGRISSSEAARQCGVSRSTFNDWVMRFQSEGADAFRPFVWNRVYSYELKLQAVHAVLYEGMSLKDVCIKFQIRSKSTLRHWIEVYNAHGDLNSVNFSGGGSYMSKGRNTTQEERVRIAKECIENGNNYGAMADKYGVSYTQARNWTKKYIEMGEAGLEDRRGKRTKDQEPRSELEEERVKRKIAEHELELAKMEIDLLKKLKEVERRNASQK